MKAFKAFTNLEAIYIALKRPYLNDQEKHNKLALFRDGIK